MEQESVRNLLILAREMFGVEYVDAPFEVDIVLHMFDGDNQQKMDYLMNTFTAVKEQPLGLCNPSIVVLAEPVHHQDWSPMHLHRRHPRKKATNTTNSHTPSLFQCYRKVERKALRWPRHLRSIKFTTHLK